MALSESLGGYFADFGEIATWKGTTDIVVIFDEESLVVLGEVETTAPSLQVIAEDVPGIKRGDSIVVGGGNYTVASKPQQDITGKLLTIALEKA